MNAESNGSSDEAMPYKVGERDESRKCGMYILKVG